MTTTDTPDSTALAVIERVHAQLAELPRVAELVAENLGGGTITARDLTRIHIPAGGGRMWEYPTAAGPEPRATFEGIILHKKNARAYWPIALDQGGGNVPPDCKSDDGITGVGDPGGECKTCPFAQWGSKGEGSNAQACKSSTLMTTMVPGEGLPVVVQAPPGSLNSVKDYMMQLTSSTIAFWKVVTEFGLEQTKNKGGIKFSRIVMRRLATLDEPAQAAVADARVQMAPLFGTVEVHAADVG